MALADELAEFVRSTVSGVEIVPKYGGTLFTLFPEEKEGQFCGLFVYKKHVQLSFSRGAELQDTDQLLEGSGVRRRHINFASIDEVDFEALARLLREAARFSG